MMSIAELAAAYNMTELQFVATYILSNGALLSLFILGIKIIKMAKEAEKEQ